jgi:5'-nucleotidase (lipoprotein e(P4) family)
MRRSATALLFALAFASCRTPVPVHAPAAMPPVTAAAAAPADAALALRYQQLSATLWQQTSPEYRALGQQAYTLARVMLDAALADPNWTAAPEQEGDFSRLPPAIVLDIDETTIDTSGYQGGLIRAGVTHSDERFAQFSASGESRAFEGTREFLAYAQSRGVKVFYLTNRRAKWEEVTRQQLAAVGLPIDESEDTVILRGERPEWEPGDKGPRRRSIAERYRIVLLFGDDFNDFVPSYGMNTAQRDEIFERVKGNFGTKWIVLPNAIYGSWDRAVVHGLQRPTAAEELERRLGSLRGTWVPAN